MPRVAKPTVDKYSCPNPKCAQHSCPFSSKGNWERHRDAGSEKGIMCRAQRNALAKNAPIVTEEANPKYHTQPVGAAVQNNITVSGNGNTVYNINIVSTPNVFPLGSEEEILRGVRLSNEVLEHILGDPLHLTLLRYMKQRQGEVEFSNIRVPNVGQDVVWIKTLEGLVQKTGKGAYLEVAIMLHEVVRKILLAKEQEVGEHEASDKNLQQIEDYGNVYSLYGPLEPSEIERGKLKDIKQGIEIELKTDPGRSTRPKRIAM